jgi:hypothetical protein
LWTGVLDIAPYMNVHSFLPSAQSSVMRNSSVAGVNQPILGSFSAVFQAIYTIFCRGCELSGRRRRAPSPSIPLPQEREAKQKRGRRRATRFVGRRPRRDEIPSLDVLGNRLKRFGLWIEKVRK